MRKVKCNSCGKRFETIEDKKLKDNKTVKYYCCYKCLNKGLK